MTTRKQANLAARRIQEIQDSRKHREHFTPRELSGDDPTEYRRSTNVLIRRALQSKGRTVMDIV